MAIERIRKEIQEKLARKVPREKTHIKKDRKETSTNPDTDMIEVSPSEIRKQIKSRIFEKIKPDRKMKLKKDKQKNPEKNIFIKIIEKKVEKGLRPQLRPPSPTAIFYYKTRLYLKETKNLTSRKHLSLAIKHPHLRAFYDDRYKCVLVSFDFIQTNIENISLKDFIQMLRQEEALLEGRLGKREYMLLELENPLKEKVVEKMLPIKGKKIGPLFLRNLPKCPLNPEPFKTSKSRNAGF